MIALDADKFVAHLFKIGVVERTNEHCNEHIAQASSLIRIGFYHGVASGCATGDACGVATPSSVSRADACSARNEVGSYRMTCW